MKLLEQLALKYPESSRSTLRKWLKGGRILVDGKKVKEPHTEIPQNATISLKEKAKYLELDIKILYEDRDLVAIEKPEGVLSVATCFEEKETVHGILKRHYPRVFPVHRLDRETSGVMVMALTEKGREGLKNLFYSHSIERKYIAIVRGTLSGEGLWKCRLLEDQNYYVRPHPRGALAMTYYRSLNIRKKTTSLELTLKTGKKNQIRAQSLAEGFPIMGDQKYGDHSSDRLYLHASYLSFAHPTIEKTMCFHSPPPFEI